MFWSGLALAVAAVMAGFWGLGGPWVLQAASHDNPMSRGRWLWPWVCALAPWCTWLVSWRMRRRFGLRMRQAGAHPRWRPEQWMALRVFMGLLSAFVAGMLAWVWDIQPQAFAVLMACVGFLASCLPDYSLRRQTALRLIRMQREVPFMLDLLTLCVEAGLSLHAALQQAAQHAPPGSLRQSLQDALAAIRTGVPRDQALEQWAEACMLPAVRSLVLALAQADQLGMSLSPVLRAQAGQQRSERFLRAEKLALEAPVKMLFPMVLCIFPCTFLVIAFPVIVKLLEWT